MRSIPFQSRFCSLYSTLAANGTACTCSAFIGFFASHVYLYIFRLFLKASFCFLRDKRGLSPRTFPLIFLSHCFNKRRLLACCLPVRDACFCACQPEDSSGAQAQLPWFLALVKQAPFSIRKSFFFNQTSISVVRVLAIFFIAIHVLYQSVWHHGNQNSLVIQIPFGQYFLNTTVTL